MGRHPVVELVNAALSGSFVYVTRGFSRVFGRVVKVTVLFGFTVNAFKTDRVRSSRSKQLETMVVPPILTLDLGIGIRQRKKRGTGGSFVSASAVEFSAGPPHNEKED